MSNKNDCVCSPLQPLLVQVSKYPASEDATHCIEGSCTDVFNHFQTALSFTQGWLGAGGTLLSVRHHFSDYVRHIRQAKQHVWWHHRLRHRVILPRAAEKDNGEEVLLWPDCWVRWKIVFPFPCLNSQLEILQCDDCRRFGFLIKNEINFISIVVFFFFFLIPLWLYWVSKSLLFLIIPSLLWLYLRARHGRDGHSYCSVKGCERVKITATTSSKETCNCTAKAYPKYAKAPSVVVPMPALNTQPCRDCGAKQVC